ncbi:pilus assembly protein TadG-related protein [Actinomadura miaoliensis]|uniref:Putative Flp pilus-assembly TadG-like N-terminal domain-containing protein n=1 Tax=Actinomadura miaoliensis TaxID=430685 RepID=A0ABP7X091_9ACTN
MSLGSTIATDVQQPRPSDQGAISLFVVVFFVALLAAVGLVVDGGAKIRAARRASAVAEEAARAGAGRIDRDRAYAHGGRFTVDRTIAVHASRAYLASTGTSGSVSVVSDQKIRVTVTISKPTLLLAAVGVGELSVTKTATADLLQGVEAPDR